MKLRVMVLTVVFVCTMLLSAVSAEEITGDVMSAAIDGSLYINLFDVRSEEEYGKGAIPGASSIPLEELENTIRGILDQGYSAMDADVYLYGETAEESAEAARIMTGLGFTNVRYLPGIAAWTGKLESPDQVMGNMDTVDIYGNAVDKSLIAGQELVMVNVWATYCNPCISEMQGLGELSRELKDQGIMILGLLSDCSNQDLSANEAQTQLAREIVEATKADYPHILPNRTIYRNVLTQVQAVPTTFFVDGDGNMVGKVFLGSRDAGDWREIIMNTLRQQQ